MDSQGSDRTKDHGGIEVDVRSRILDGIPVTEQTLELSGISTAVLEGGEGRPIVLLHGPGEYAAKWFRVIPDLTKTHRVIAPDLPGHGNSAAITDTFDAERVLSWLDELIDKTCPVPPILTGQILGGAIAALYSSRFSDRIGRLVLVDSLGLAPFQPRPNFGKALQEFIMQPNEENHDRFWRFCAYDLDALRDSLKDKWDLIKTYNLRRATDESHRGTQHKLMEQFGMTPIPTEELQQIAVPTTLIWGKHDLATSVEVAEAISDQYGWPLHIIENAADDPPMEQPRAFVAALEAALADSNPSNS